MVVTRGSDSPQYRLFHADDPLKADTKDEVPIISEKLEEVGEALKRIYQEPFPLRGNGSIYALNSENNTEREISKLCASCYRLTSKGWEPRNFMDFEQLQEKCMNFFTLCGIDDGRALLKRVLEFHFNARTIRELTGPQRDMMATIIQRMTTIRAVYNGMMEREAEGVRTPESPFKLSLILPADHEAVKSILAEKRFEAGPVVVVVHSVVSHHFEGVVTIGKRRPLVRIASPDRGPAFLLPEFGQIDPKEFSEKLEAALMQAQQHAATVENWINREIMTAVSATGLRG